MKTTAIINGKIVTESGIQESAIVIQEGKIAALLQADADVASLYGDCEMIDAKGQYVVPGGVDGHIHFAGFGDIPTCDNFITGSEAAFAGGTTTIVDFCQPVGISVEECVRICKEAGSTGAVDYAFHFVFTENYKEELKKLPFILKEGITAFKGYTYYDGTCLVPGDFRIVMEQIHDKGCLLIHAEEKSIIECEKKRYDGDMNDFSALYKTRPNISEQLAIENVLAIAKETGTKICIAHTSSKEGADIRAREKALGNDAFILESCPHYLEFTEEDSKGENGCWYTINPPLRGESDKKRLFEAVMKEEISILSTDHCNYADKYKRAGHTYETVPCGVDGVQTRMTYLFSEAVMKHGLDMSAFVRMTSTNAAKFYNLYPRKGTIRPGSDADLAFFDPAPEWIYSHDDIVGGCDHSIYEGKNFKGKCTCTIKSGKVVMKDGIVAAEPGTGRFLYTMYKG